MRTTININNNLLKRLKDTSDILMISTNDLIAMLINIVISKNILDIAIFKGIRYQDPDPQNRWRKYHVRFEPQMYEKGLDLRKAFKVSVSFIISFAILHFLDEIKEKLINDVQEVDNYPLNYIFISNMHDDIQSFTIFWGMPNEKILKKLLP